MVGLFIESCCMMMMVMMLMMFLQCFGIWLSCCQKKRKTGKKWLIAERTVALTEREGNGLSTVVWWGVNRISRLRILCSVPNKMQIYESGDRENCLKCR